MEKLAKIDKKETPEWLTQFVNNQDLNSVKMDQINIRNILKDSCYYFFSGSDITPIITFEKYIHSYVYCDNCLDQDGSKAIIKLKQRLHDNNYRNLFHLNTNLKEEKYHGTKHLAISRPNNDELSIWKKTGIYIVFYIYFGMISVYIIICMKNILYSPLQYAIVIRKVLKYGM